MACKISFKLLSVFCDYTLVVIGLTPLFHLLTTTPCQGRKPVFCFLSRHNLAKTCFSSSSPFAAADTFDFYE